MHPHQHFLIAVYWRLDVPQFQHLWFAVGVLDDGLHGDSH
jgi:hypothetical protein